MKENKRAEQDLLKGNVLNLSSCILDPVVHQTINSTMMLTVWDHKVIQAGRNLKKSGPTSSSAGSAERLELYPLGS